MAVAWSGRADDEPDHPDPPVIIAAMAVDSANPSGVARRFRPLEPTQYAPPDGLQEDDVIEPTRVFKPWVLGDYWRNVEITVEYHDLYARSTVQHGDGPTRTRARA